MAACPVCGADNPGGARFCSSCGERIPTPGPGTEVRKTVTVVFCDVTGSTSLGQRLDPEALRQVMGRYFAAMTAAIEHHGGTVEKFIGDAVMAVFGTPTVHEDDALRALRAVDEMRTALGALDDDLRRDHGVSLTCRIGVHTGEVVAGVESARQALVTGDAVNVAARLQQAAPAGATVLSDETLSLVRDAAVVEPVEPMELRGRSGPVRAHRLLGVRPDSAGVARRLDSPLVGRVRQLAQIRAAFEEVVAERVCHLCTVLGPPGVGKTRLVQEAVASMTGNARVVHGRCLSYGEAITYWPLAEIVRDAVGPSRFDRRGELGTAIREVVQDDPAGEQVAVRVASLIGATHDLAVPAEETGWAVRRFFEALARTRPLVVVVDDLQWAEPAFLDLLDQVTDLSRDAPILLVCLARPELLDLRAGWGGGKRYASALSLEPLSADESQLLVENLLGGQGLDEPALRRIVVAAEGIPLFLEATLGMLVDDGVLRHEGGRWRAVGAVGSAEVPPTIQAVLTARLDRLQVAERAVLGRAAVVGQVFYLAALQDLAPSEDRASTPQHVRQLVRRDLVRPEVSDIPGQEAYRFQHSLLRDAAYRMLPKQVRAELHERFADWLAGAELAIDVDEIVGYHLERAHACRAELGPEDEHARSLATRAAERLSAAGSRAFDRADSRAARTLFARAAALRQPDDPRRAWDLIELGWAESDVFDLAGMRGAFDEALRAARSCAAERAEAHAELGLAWTDWVRGTKGWTDPVIALLERLIPRLESWGDDRGLARAYFVRGGVPWSLCHYESCRQDSALVLHHARLAGDAIFEQSAAVNRAVAGLIGSSDVEQIRADLVDLAAAATRLPSLKATELLGRATVEALQGRFEDARVLLAAADATCQEMLGRPSGPVLEWSGTIEMLAGDAVAAEGHVRRLYDWLHESGGVGFSSTSAGELSIICHALGREDEARRLATECRETSPDDDVVNQVLWRRAEARLRADEGRLDEALTLIREAAAWVGRTDMLLEQANVAFDEALLAHRAGLDEEERTALLQARAAADAKGALVLVARADQRLAELDP